MPPPDREQRERCKVVDTSSRICELGTKGCDVMHVGGPTDREAQARELARLLNVEVNCYCETMSFTAWPTGMPKKCSHCRTLDLILAYGDRRRVEGERHSQQKVEEEHAECGLPWQPITTAPKTREKVLLWWPESGPTPMVGRWSPRSGVWFTLDGHGYGAPTHWMPLPTPPREEPEG